MPDDLLRSGSEFPILGDSTYLISNSLGAMARRYTMRRITTPQLAIAAVDEILAGLRAVAK